MPIRKMIYYAIRYPAAAMILPRRHDVTIRYALPITLLIPLFYCCRHDVIRQRWLTLPAPMLIGVVNDVDVFAHAATLFTRLSFFFHRFADGEHTERCRRAGRLLLPMMLRR